MKLTLRKQQSVPDPEIAKPYRGTDEETRAEIKAEFEKDLWRVDWKRAGYNFCGIYCVSPDNGWPTKVGVSQNPSRRLVGLQTACWKRLDIAAYRYAENSLKAREVEKKTHRMLTEDGKLMAGEWFDVRPEKALEAIEFAALSLGIELRSDVPDEKVRKALGGLFDARRMEWSNEQEREDLRKFGFTV